MNTIIFSAAGKELRRVVSPKPLTAAEIIRQVANLAELHDINPESIRWDTGKRKTDKTLRK